MSFLLWKLLHIASVIIFLGNITTGLFWARHAHKSRDFSLIAATFDGIIRSDRLFTIPGIIGIIVSGVAAASGLHLPILGTGWILWGITLFAISGIVYGIWVAPLQGKIVNLARSADSCQQDKELYVRAFRKWELWGLVALTMPVIAGVIMVLKPALPGL